LKFAPMTIPAMALLQKHDAQQDILIEPAAQQCAAIEARGILNWGRSELGAQSGRKNQPACLKCASAQMKTAPCSQDELDYES